MQTETNLKKKLNRITRLKSNAFDDNLFKSLTEDANSLYKIDIVLNGMALRSGG